MANFLPSIDRLYITGSIVLYHESAVMAQKCQSCRSVLNIQNHDHVLVSMLEYSSSHYWLLVGLHFVKNVLSSVAQTIIHY